MSIDPLTQEHHYLPQFYQRRWASEDGTVVVFERPRDDVRFKRRGPRATGKQPGLYAIPLLPECERNSLENGFWRIIDQWGADALAILEADAPSTVPDLARSRWGIFLLSLIFRAPSSIERINSVARQYYETDFTDFARQYDELRAPYEPETFEAFIATFDKPGMSEFGARILRSFSTNREILVQLLAMDWQVVTVSRPPVSLLTSDRPLIRYKGLKDADGLLMLPLGPDKFFVAYNPGPIDMRAWIEDSIVNGRFMEAMNEYVVGSAVRFVYGASEAELPTVEKFLRRSSDPVAKRW
jgi:hypothetical protein